jgi:hypothetical protein
MFDSLCQLAYPLLPTLVNRVFLSVFRASNADRCDDGIVAIFG